MFQRDSMVPILGSQSARNRIFLSYLKTTTKNLNTEVFNVAKRKTTIVLGAKWVLLEDETPVSHCALVQVMLCNAMIEISMVCHQRWNKKERTLEEVEKHICYGDFVLVLFVVVWVQDLEVPEVRADQIVSRAWFWLTVIRVVVVVA